MNKAVLIVLNNEFVIGFRAMMNSLLTHTPSFGEPVICLDLDLTDISKELCREVYKDITFVKPDFEQYHRLPPHAPALKNTFYKIEAFRIANNYDRLLFIDCDIVFVGPIYDLLEIGINADIGMCYHREHKEHNTGLVIYNRIHKDRYKAILKLMRRLVDSKLGDQTLIKKAIQKGIIIAENIDNKWNVTKRQVKRQGITNYVGLHFVGAKPWKGGEKGYEQIEAIWQKYSLSPPSDTASTDVTSI